MENKQEIIEMLTRAREIFREHGGLKDNMEDAAGNVCAEGALYKATKNNKFANYHEASKVLCDASFKLHGAYVTQVNDDAEDPMPVILDLYDHAIKELENDE